MFEALIFPDIESCRLLAGVTPDTPAAEIISADRVREKFSSLLGALAAASQGSSTRVKRAILLAEPPSMDKGEMTDKGSINQRAVLKNRSAVVDELYATTLSPRIITAKDGR